MSATLSRRLAKLEKTSAARRRCHIIVAPPSIHDEEEWLREYAPQYKEWREERKQRMGPTVEVIYPDRAGGYVWRREEVPVGDATRLHELLEIGGRVSARGAGS
jgi:hypothetical protein